MLATLTSKGQVPLPKQIRDKLGLKAGSKLDIELLRDGTVNVYRADLTALSIMGMMKRPGQRLVSIEEMNDGITSFLAESTGGNADDANRSDLAFDSGDCSIVDMQRFNGR